MRARGSGQVEYICALVQEDGASKTAKKLGIFRPALSRQGMLTEQEQETQLFGLSQTPFKLTPNDRTYLDAAKKTLDIRDGQDTLGCRSPAHD